MTTPESLDVEAAGVRLDRALIATDALVAALGPADLAEDELVVAQTLLARLPEHHRPFEAPQPVADRAPAVDRLAALLGRTVADPVED